MVRSSHPRPSSTGRFTPAVNPARAEPLEGRVLMSFQPEGDLLRLNQTSERYDFSPDVAMDANGDFVTVWESSTGTSAKIVARRFDRNGRPRTDDIVVSAPGAAWGVKPDVGTDARGNFVVAWLGVEPNGKPEMYARLYDAHGRPQGGIIRVDPGGEPTPGHGGEVAAAMSDDGSRFFVAWREMDDRELPPEIPRHPALPEGFVLRGQVMRGRMFDGGGAPLGDAFTVHASDERTSRREVAAAMDKDGDLVVTWQHVGFGAKEDGIFARRFDRAGNPLTGDVLVNDPGGDDERGHPSVATEEDGDFVVAWRDERGPGTSLLARRFTAAGAPAGAAALISNYAAPHYSPVGADVAVGDDGAYLASWRVDDGVFARHFDAAGRPLGAEINLGAGNDAFPMAANVAMDRKGRRAAVVWGRNEIVAPWGAGNDGNAYARLLRDAGKDDGREAVAAGRQPVRSAYAVSRRRDFRPRPLASASAASILGG